MRGGREGRGLWVRTCQTLQLIVTMVPLFSGDCFLPFIREFKGNGMGSLVSLGTLAQLGKCGSMCLQCSSGERPSREGMMTSSVVRQGITGCNPRIIFGSTSDRGVGWVTRSCACSIRGTVLNVSRRGACRFMSFFSSHSLRPSLHRHVQMGCQARVKSVGIKVVYA